MIDELFLVFGITLLLSSLVSGFAQRSVLSTAVLFLFAGYLFAEPLGLYEIPAQSPGVRLFTELAVFSVLFTDGMHINVSLFKGDWRLPARALLIGLPLTFVGTALLAHYLAGLSWLEAMLVGAALSPTDPVLASAIVGRTDVSERLRHLLNIESGMNDGLAAPVVAILIELTASETTHVLTITSDVLLGVLIGPLIAGIAIYLERQHFLRAVGPYEALTGFATGLIIFAAATMLHANGFLAAFGAGLTFAFLAPHLKDSFQEFGETVAELLKLAALLVFGSLISFSEFSDVGWGGIAFAVCALLLVRPVALGVALIGERLGRKEWMAAAWFGPKGFASAVFGLLILSSGMDGATHLFHLIAIVVVASIVLHSSTDVLAAEWLNSGEEKQPKQSMIETPGEA